MFWDTRQNQIQYICRLRLRLILVLVAFMCLVLQPVQAEGIDADASLEAGAVADRQKNVSASQQAESGSSKSRKVSSTDRQKDKDREKKNAEKKDKKQDKKQNKGDSGSKSSVAGAKKKKSEFPNVLPTLTWVDPDHDQKAVLLCVHGLGLNSDAYSAFGERMSKLGYLVYAVDVPGFGSFQQARGEDREKVNFDNCLLGIADTLRLIHKVNQNLPVFIVGESMGGAIALRVTSEHPELVDGLISSVPSGDRFKQNKEKLRVGLKLLTAPNKPFDIGSSVIERVVENLPEGEKDDLRKKMAEDRLSRMELTPKELVSFQNFMNDNFPAARKIKSRPVLFVQGGEDRLVRPEGTQDLFNAIGSPVMQKQFELIDDKGHLILEENQFDNRVIEIIDKWLIANIESVKLTKK